MRTSRSLPSLVSLRASLLAAMGLAACSGTVQTGSSGSSSTGSAGGGAGGAGGQPPECAGAVPVAAVDGSPSGFSRCPDGTIHRVAPASCDPAAGVSACSGTEMMVSCKSDADCTMKPHGRCGAHVVSTFGGDMTACDCVYPCAGDAECDAGQVCVCAGVVPADQSFSFCAAAQCVSGADCASGECGISSYNDGCGLDVELACRKPSDMCRLDSMCTMPGQHCVLDALNGPKPTWACAGTQCAIGRPLVVDGEARTAPAVERADWLAADLRLSTSLLDARAREALAAHWLDVAALEHASVASFARFTLELLMLGAPAHLVADAQRAALDEVEHARLAYAAASAYAGRAFGPGALDVGCAAMRAMRASAREVMRALIVEGCVGETLGVAEAAALAEVVADPALREVHARIAEDEQRHAELAWRTLAWMLSGAGEEAGRFAGRCFEEAAAAAGLDPAARAVTAPEHGLLAAEALGAIRRRALAEVIAPCAATVLGSAKARRAAEQQAHA